MNREAKIGLFVLIGAAVMFFFIMKTGKIEESLFRKGQAKREVTLHLEDASGIRNETPVRIAGVRVGEVRRILLDDAKALVIITLPKPMVLFDGAYAELQNQGVLGERYISIFPGVGAPLADQNRLDGIAPPSIGDLTTSINKLAENMLAITENLKQSTITPQGKNRVELITENIERLTQALVSMVEDNRANLKTTTDEFAKLTQALNRDVPNLLAEMTALLQELHGAAGSNRGNIDQTLASVATVSENMEQVTASLSSIAQKVDSGQGSIGKLINEGDSVDKLNKVLDTANESLGEVKNLLGKANDIQIDLHFRGEYLARQESTKGYFGVTLRPNPNKYYLFEGVSRDVDFLVPKVRESTDFVFDADGNLVNTIVHRREETPEDFVFNGLLAYRFGDLYLKGGALESTIGAGFDFLTLKDKMIFSLETFDFNREVFGAYGRLRLQYQPLKSIHFMLGWDDFLESDLSSASFGAGLRWKDEDIKLLLTNMGRFF